MSVRAKSFARDVSVDQYLDTDGVLFFWNKIKAYIETNMPDIEMSDQSLLYGSFFVSYDWTELPAINTPKVVPMSTMVGKLPSVNDYVMGLIHLTDGTIYIAYSNVTAIQDPPYTSASSMTLTFLQFWEFGDASWDKITGKPDIALKSDLANYPTNAQMNTAIANATAGTVTSDQVNTQINAKLTAYSTTEQMNTAISNAVSSVYRYAGSVSTYANLPTSDLTNGDVYNVTDTDMNYAWVMTDSGGYWDPLGSTFSVEPIPNSVIQEIVDGTYGS